MVLSLSVAQPQQTSPDFNLQMSLSRSQVLTIEPIQALVSLQNKSEKVQAIRSSLIFTIYYHREGEEKWQPFIPSGPNSTPMIPQSAIFQPGEAINGQFFFLDVASSGEPFFNQPGWYWLKAVFNDLNIESLPQKVHVISPVGKDEEAYAYLLQRRLYKYFILQPGGLLAAQKSDSPVQELTEFLKRYNETKYADYAKCALGLLNLYGFTVEKNPQQSETYFKELANRHDNPIAEWGYYYLGIARAEQNDVPMAVDIFSHVIAETKNPVLKAMAETRRKEFLNRIKGNSKVNPPLPPAEQAIKQLEAEWHLSRTDPYRGYLGSGRVILKTTTNHSRGIV